MAFTKYQSVEKSSLVPPKESAKIRENIIKVGKTSAAQLSDEERATALKP